MRKVYLEGQLGEKFGAEWSLDVASPAEALTAIMAQRPGMRQYLAQSEGIQGYEVLIGDEPIEREEELCMLDPGTTQSYSFVPVIGGSKSSGLMMVLGVALLAATGGLAGFGITGFMGASGMTVGSAATAAQATAISAATGTTVAAGTTITASMSVAVQTAAMGVSAPGMLMATQGLGYLGTALVLGGAAMMLAPDVPDQASAEKAENYLFGGPVNTVKQGEAIPLVYGRAIVGSKTISASVFTNTSRQKLTAGRKMVGIPNFRTDGSKSGTNNIAQENTGYAWDIGPGPHL